MRLTLLLCLPALLFWSPLHAQIGIGTATPNPHAVLDLKSSGHNQGLLLPTISNSARLASAMTTAMTPSENGLLVFDTDDNTFYYWNGTQWDPVLHGQGAPPLGTAGGDLTGNYPNPTLGNSRVTTATIADGSILDADINSAAGIQDAKLATVTTPGKVSGNAITSGTIGGNTTISTTGSITAASIHTLSATTTATFQSTNNAAEGGVAISGVTASTGGGYGLYGEANGATLNKVSSYSYGVYGKNDFSKTFGYIGGQYGIYGESPSGPGIQGKGTTGVSGNGGTTGGIGVYGTASGTGSYGVYSSGTAGGTSTWNATSDRRYKKNVETLQGSLSKILALRGVGFEWRTDEFPEKNFSSLHDLGFIAQEIKEILPEVVLIDKEGYYTVSYEKVVPVLVEAIKQQQKEIENLKKSQTEMEEIKSKMASLEAMLQTVSPAPGLSGKSRDRNEN